MRSILLAATVFLLGCAAPGDPVREAIDAGDHAALRAALASKPNLEPVCGPYEICKPLAAAASRGDLVMVTMLIEAGADPNGRNAYGDTAFIVAGDLASVKKLPTTDVPAIRAFLLQHGLDPIQTNQFDMSPLLGLAAMGDIPLLEVAVQQGGEINKQSPKRHSTPLMEASAYGKTDTVRWLLAHGADHSLRDIDGRTARDLAQKGKHAAVMALLPKD